MKQTMILASLVFGALFIAGCGNTEPASTANEPAAKTPATTTTVAYDIGTKKKGDKGVCVVCNSKEGTTTEEEVKEMVDYQGKTYIFCNEAEKAEFIAEPAKYAKK